MTPPKPRTVGLVELWIDLPARPAPSLSALLATTAANDPRRIEHVREILEHPALRGLSALVFPGWTLPGPTLPDWVLAASAGRVIVIELVSIEDETLAAKASKSDSEVAAGDEEADFPWTTFVVRDGRVLTEATQLFATAGQAAIASAELVSLVGRPESPRVFADDSLGERVGLLVCGEVNVATKHDGEYRVPAGFPPLDVVLNPAHTPGRLQAMREKRSRLSVGSALVTTANTHSRWNHDGATGPAAYVAAECYVNGARLARGAVHQIGPSAVVVHDISPA